MSSAVQNPVAPAPQTQTQAQTQNLLQLIWTYALGQVAQGNVSALIIPGELKSLVRQECIDELRDRYSQLIAAPVTVFEDTTIDAIVIKRQTTAPAPRPARMPASQNGKAALKVAKVPRPPNSFILYRQHHHPIIKAQHPDYHNNRISTMLGEQWSREAPDVKARWKAVADDIKRKHAEMFPDYQYQPRKPSEKKRRMTRRKAAAIAGLSDSQGPSVSAQSYDTTMAGALGDQVVASASASSSTDIGTADSPALLNDYGENFTTDQPEAFEIEDIPEVLPIFETASNGNLFVDLNGSFSDEAFCAMLAEHNATLPEPPLQQPGLNLPNDYPAVSFNQTEESTNDQSFFSSMCDWEGLGHGGVGNTNNVLPDTETEAELDWENDWSFLATAELERMPA